MGAYPLPRPAANGAWLGQEVRRGQTMRRCASVTGSTRAPAPSNNSSAVDRKATIMGVFVRMMICTVSISMTAQPGFAQTQTTAENYFWRTWTQRCFSPLCVTEGCNVPFPNDFPHGRASWPRCSAKWLEFEAILYGGWRSCGA